MPFGYRNHIQNAKNSSTLRRTCRYLIMRSFGETALEAFRISFIGIPCRTDPPETETARLSNRINSQKTGFFNLLFYHNTFPCVNC